MNDHYIVIQWALDVQCQQESGPCLLRWKWKNCGGKRCYLSGNVTNIFIWGPVGVNRNKIWFQQNGTTAHTARDTMDLLRHFFTGHLIAHIGDNQWPPWSLDLSAPDYFLWGCFKPGHIVFMKNRTRQKTKLTEIQICCTVLWTILMKNYKL
jgi:hypothetical protein